jgi:hypothetical protein
MSVLMAACNPIVNDILPSNEPQKPVTADTTITIDITVTGNIEGDSVTASTVQAEAGDKVTINYALARAKINNRLVFSGTTPALAQADSAGPADTPVTGTREYTVKAEDAVNGVITINAVFTHSDKTLNTITFAEDSVTKAYGDLPFTNTITNTGEGTGAITFSSSDTTVATVDSSTGVVTILKVGTTTITATKAEDANYAGTAAVYTLTVTKAVGRTVTVPTAETVTQNSITINAVTVTEPAYEQTAEYAISTASSPIPTSGWQTGLTFSGLNSSTNYYIFARSKENENCKVGEAQVSAAIKTEASITIKIDMKDFTNGDSVTATPSKGEIGDTITISYTLVRTHINNRIVFFGTTPALTQVDADTGKAETPKTGTMEYTIKEEDAAERVITIIATFTHTNKTIDTIAFADSSNETKVYGSGTFPKALTNTGSGTGAITYSSSDTTVATVNSSTGVVTILKVGKTDISATKEGDDNYEGTKAFYVLTVEPKPVTITGLAAQNREYNGNTVATATGTAVIDGRVGSDDVTVTAGSAAFANKDVGDNKTVTFSGYSLGGAAKDNYVLSAQPANVTANITELQLTIANPTVTTTKQFNNTTTAAVTAGALTNKFSNDTVNVSATGTYASANVGTNITITVEYAISGTDAGNYIKPVNYPTTGSITKATGITVSAPTVASRTTTSITVNPVTLTPDYGQGAEYAISETSSATSWQDGLTFSGLTANTPYNVFARSKANDNCNVGDARSSATRTAITDDVNRMTVVDFEADELNKTYGSIAKVVEDPANSGQKSLQINGTGNQYVTVPVYLSSALSNYEYFTFRFRMVSGNPGTDLYYKIFNVYASTNPSGSTANSVGNLPQASYNDAGFQNTWTDYIITIPLNSLNATISGLQGQIYITMGISSSSINYLLDDITFVLRNGVPTPGPSITPTTAAFNKQAQADIPVTMTPRGKTLTSITNNGTALTSGTHYTVSDNEVTLKASYLAAQADGTTTLTFNFSGGDIATIVITITDGAPVVQTILWYDFSGANNVNGALSTVTPKTGGDSGVTMSVNVNNGVLIVSKTNTNYSNGAVFLPFKLDTGKKISDYKCTVNVQGVLPSGGSTGDWTNKDFKLSIRASNATGAGSQVASMSSSGGAALPTDGGFKDIVLTSLTGTNEGEFELGFGFTGSNGYTINIRSVKLELK